MLKIRTPRSSLELDDKEGAKITNLTLSLGKEKYTIIESIAGSDFYLSGNYLLYPWVNRISSKNISYIHTDGNRLDCELVPEMSDSNGFPSHGLYTKKNRRIVLKEETIDRVSVILEPTEWDFRFPYFQEEFNLYVDRLVIKTVFENRSNSPQFFSYGYHPYFSPGVDLGDCKIVTNLDSYIPLEANLLPPQSFTRSPISDILKPTGGIPAFLDHCFVNTRGGNSYMGLYIPSRDVHIICKSYKGELDLPFFQVYTPDSQRIAIEPMSSSGDVFANPNSKPFCLLPQKKVEGKVEFLLSKEAISL
jgi:galactose mutarotase-like enzyme